MPSSPDSGSSPPSDQTPPLPPEQSSPQPEPLPPGPDPRRSFPWFWLGAFVGTILSGAGIGLAIWAWAFIQDDLSPLISKTLTESLDRPVELGDLEKVTFGSLQVGPSELGASSSDSTTVTADTVIVKFDLIKTLLTSELGLDLIVEGADGYLEQDADKGWLNVEIPEQAEQRDERFKVRLNDIRIQDSQLTLVPLPTASGELQPIPIDDLQGSVAFDKVTVAGEDARRTRFEVSGNPQAGGELTVKGEVQPVPRKAGSESQSDQGQGDNVSNLQFATNLSIQGNKAPLGDILNFTLATINFQTDAVTIDSGAVSGTLEMAIQPEEPVDYSGVLSVENGALDTNVLPLPLENLEGQTQFEGNRWTIDRLSGDYGGIEAVAEGLLDFDNDLGAGNGYELSVEADNVTVDEFTATLDLPLPVPAEGNFDAIAQVSGPLGNPQVIGSAIADTAVTIDRFTFSDARTGFSYADQQILLNDIVAIPEVGGELTGSGQVRLGAGTPFAFQVAGRGLPAKAIANLYDINPNFTLGLVAADATVTGQNGRFSTTIDWDAPEAQYPGSGVVDINGNTIAFRDTVFQIGGGTVSGVGTLVGQQWSSDVTFANVQLNTFSDTLLGDVNGQFQFSGTTADASIGAISARGNVAFSDGLAAFNRQFASFNSLLTAEVAWNGDKIEIIQAESDRIFASGTLTPTFDRGFTGLQRFDLNLSAQGYDLATLPVALPSAIALSGLTDFTGTLSGSPDAPVLAGNLQLADLVVNRLPFNPLLTGTIDYNPNTGINLNVAGGTDKIAFNIDPSSRAGGQGTFSPGIPRLDFDVNWRDAFATGQTQGNLLNIQAGNFPLSILNFPAAGAAGIGQLRGTLTAADMAFNLTNQTLEGDINIAQLGLGYIGAANLIGNVRYANNLVTLTNGQLVLNGNQSTTGLGEDLPSIGNLYTLNGRVTLGQGAPIYSANIETQQGSLQNLLAALSIYRLEDFRRGLTPPEWVQNPYSQSELDAVLATSPAVRADAALIDQLRRLSEIQAIQAEAERTAALQPLPPLSELEGPFAGEFQLNGQGSDFQLDFDLAGQNWQWGRDYSAEDVVATGNLRPGVLTLEPVRLASVIEPPAIAPAPAGEIAPNEIAPGETDASETGASELTALEPTDLQPALPADGVTQQTVASVDLAGQLVFGRNTELTSNLQATAQNLNVEAVDDILRLPLDIQGLANAQATLGGTLANPQLRGAAALADVTINDTPIQSATAQFLYQNAQLSLNSALIADAPEQPLRLQAQIPRAFGFMDVQPKSDNIFVNIDVKDEGLALLNIFTDQVAWESGSGQFNLQVGGTLKQPEISGLATLDDAVLRAKILPEPLTNVTGRAVFEGEKIIVEGLEGQFSDGQLTAAGTFPLLNPIISGAQLTVLTSPAIPEEVVPGEGVEPGEVGQGELSPAEIAEDTIAEEMAQVAKQPDNTDPLFPLPLAPNLPLTVNLQNIALQLNKLYSGDVNGQVVIGGSALLNGPQIGGEVILSNGQVVLSNNTGDAALSNGSVSPTGQPSSIAVAQTPRGITPQFRDLRLTLGRDIRIVQGNLLNFVADGTLRLNGSVRELEPDGIISLRSGRVSLYTTLFRLRGRDNTAIFTPDMGLQNPFLNIALRASVPEVNSPGPIASTPFASAEIADTSGTGFENPGSLRTIRVRANVEGPANAIFENLELSSSPPRDQAELIGLIGGGFVTALESTVGSLSGGGDDFGGLINLVSGTLLTSIQDAIGTTLSLSDFQLFPVTAASRSSDTANNSDNGLDIGVAIGFDVTDSASLSVSKIVTDDTNPEFGLSYRLTDALTVRSATNFDDINQVLLEYEIRF